jgi:predicted amidohydrolase
MEIRDKIRITLAQVNLLWESPGENLKYLDDKIEKLSEPTDIIILPETFTSGFSMNPNQLAETMNGQSVEWMRQIAKRTNAAICGSLIIRDKDLFYNRFVFAKPDGEIIHYDKRHLFSMGGEKSVFTAGNERIIINYLGWRIGLYVCYDLRFPVWCRNRNDTDLMLFTANWPMSRSIVWNTLLRARAIENQVYVAGVNRIGSDGNGIKYLGESQLINPYGKPIFEPIIEEEDLFSCEISLPELNDFRLKFQVAEDADHFEIN